MADAELPADRWRPWSTTASHKERTAAALGVSLKTLYNRLKEYAADKVDVAPE